jgi:predicted transcriptional regulator YdeE
MSEYLCFERVNLPEFFVAGIAVNTTNQDGQSEKDIGDLWTRFTTQNMAQQITGKLSDDIYCVYTDYESDYTGRYTAVLGCKVENVDQIEDSFFVALIPKGDYHVYSPEGKFPDCVANTWRRIWQTPIDRKYTADYDCYKAGAKSFEETETVICLAVV